MLNRTTSRIISLALILALFGAPAIYNADAQDPPRPPEPKRPPQQQDARERKGAQRQGAQADEPGTPGEDRIKIETDMVNLDVMVVDQNNNPVANLKKEDFISDDIEKNSSSKEKEVLEVIKEDEVQVYLVGFIDEEMEEKNLFRKSPAQKAKELLSRIADDSGGRAYFPKDISEIPAIAAQISKDLRTQYVVSYYPANDKRDGAFRTIQVGVNQVGGRKLIARTRRGYYARNAQGQAPAASQKKSHGTSLR
ncbi:MAG: hypothetical protein ACREA2_02640 [Blastocatellia bacterium]